MEHRLGAPLVGHILQQKAEEVLHGIDGEDGTLRMQTFQRVEHRRGIVVPGAVGELDDGDHGRLHMREDGSALDVHLLPDVGDAAIAEDGAHLHRIGRAEAAMDDVGGHEMLPSLRLQPSWAGLTRPSIRRVSAEESLLRRYRGAMDGRLEAAHDGDGLNVNLYSGFLLGSVRPSRQ